MATYTGVTVAPAPFAAGSAKAGTQVVEAPSITGAFGSGTPIAETKAPHIPAMSDFISVAGTGQRFPYNTRVIVVEE